MPKSPSNWVNDEHRQIRLQWLKQLEAETQSLCVILEHERAVLRERRLDAVVDAVAEKNSAVARIDDLLKRLLGQSVPKQEAVQALLAGLEPDRCAEAQAVWARICRFTARCQELNEANGATIALLQEHNRRSLALLFGRQRLGYRADGQMQAEADERLLGAI